MMISLVIPAYREEDRLGATLKAVTRFMDGTGHDYEVVVVDDGSPDRTSEVASATGHPRVRLLKLAVNSGKGAAVKVGMLAASGEYRFFMDADLSTPIENVLPFLERLRKGADMCIGSRAADRSRISVRQAWHRERMGRVYNLVVRMLGLSTITDTQCGFKGFTASAAETLFGSLKTAGFSFDVELLARAARERMRIDVLPVDWANSERSSVRIFRHSAMMFLELLKVRMRL